MIDTLDQTKVTGIEPVDKAQDGVNNLVGGQFGKGGALQGVGDTFSKEGMNRAERGGKDDSVRTTSSLSKTIPRLKLIKSPTGLLRRRRRQRSKLHRKRRDRRPQERWWLCR
jgi:hypothetical protein